MVDFVAATSTASYAIPLEGETITVGSGESQYFNTDSRVNYLTGFGGGGLTLRTFCNLRSTSSERVDLKPIPGGGVNDDGIDSTSTTAGVIRPEAMYQGWMHIDLTDAPEETYDYLILATQEGSCDVVGDIGFLCKSGFRPPYTYFENDDVVNTAEDVNTNHTRVKINNAGDQAYWSGSRVIQLRGGREYAFATSLILDSTLNNGDVVTGKCPQFIAIRLDDKTYLTDGDSNLATETFGTSAADSTVAVTAATAGAYLAFCTGNLECDGTSAEVTVQVVVDGTGNYSEQEWAGAQFTATTADKGVSFGGACFFPEVTVGDVFKFNAQSSVSGENAILRDQVMTIVKVDEAPGFAQVEGASYAANGEETIAPVTFDGTTFTDIDIGHDETSSDTLRDKWNTEPDLSRSGNYLEFMTVGAYSDGTNAKTGVRVKFSGDTDEQYDDYYGRGSSDYTYPANPSSGQTYATNIWMRRGHRKAGLARNKVQVKVGATSTSGVLRNLAEVYIREEDIGQVKEDTEVAIIADIEEEVMLIRWTSGTASDTWHSKATLPFDDVEKVLRNGAELTEVSSLTNDDQWYFDATAGTVGIQVPSGIDPRDQAQMMVVVGVKHYGRTQTDVEETDGSWTSYQPRLYKIPGVTQSISARNTGVGSATSIGGLEVANGDGALDDSLVRHMLDGMRARIYRGWPSLSQKRYSFEMLANAVIGFPELNAKSVKYKLFDKITHLQNKVATHMNNVESGTSGSTVRDNQQTPVLYGFLKKVPAYRVTAVLSPAGSHRFKLCEHPITYIENVYEDADTLIPTTASYSQTREDLIAGSFEITDTSADAHKMDVLYVDVWGWPESIDDIDASTSSTSSTLVHPGEIAAHLLANYPEDTNEYIGFGSDATTWFGTVAWADTCLFAWTGGSSGDWVDGDKILVVSTDGTNHAHGVIVDDSNPTTTKVAPLYHLNDATLGTSGSGYVFPIGSKVRRFRKSKGLSESEIMRTSMSRLDRQWRKRQLDNPTTPLQEEEPTIQDRAPRAGFMFNGETMQNALDKIAQASFSYWYSSRQGRIGFGIPDHSAKQGVVNPGMEDIVYVAGDTTYSYNVRDPDSGGAAGQIDENQEYAFQGKKFYSLTSGTSGTAYLSQMVKDVPGHGGWLYATCEMFLFSGSVTDAKIGIVTGDDGFSEVLSAGDTITNNGWTRLEVLAKITEGVSGAHELRIYPTQTPSNNCTVRIDNVEMYPVNFIVHEANANYFPMKYRDQNYFKAVTPFSVNTQQAGTADSGIKLTTVGEVLGLGNRPSQSELLLASAGTFDNTGLYMRAAEDAIGLNAAILAYFSKQRHYMKFSLLCPERLPVVGDILYVRPDTRRIPKRPDDYPLWVISKVDYKSGNHANVVIVEAERQVDQVYDRNVAQGA